MRVHKVKLAAVWYQLNEQALRGLDGVRRRACAAFDEQILEARVAWPIDAKREQLEMRSEVVFVNKQLAIAGHTSAQIDFVKDLNCSK